MFTEEEFDVVCNLAAQAGVRYSIDQPFPILIRTLLDLQIFWKLAETTLLHILFMPVPVAFTD